jgi:hypothetical protein
MCAEAAKCCGEDKLCALTCCQCNIDLEKLKPLVNAPKYICEQCGRVANEEGNLCKPTPLG